MRVLASLVIIIFHYVAAIQNVPSVQGFIYKCFGNSGMLGNMLFFALSGYLAANSLERSKSTAEFYRRKIIRLTIPFAAAYVILATLLIFLGMFEPEIANQSPLQNVVNVGGNYAGILLGMLPLSTDLYLVRLLNFPVYGFVGEWFMGTIIYLFLISPLLYKLLRWNFFVTVAAAVIISLTTFNITLDWKAAGYIAENSVLFTVRIPEFLLGMILFTYRDFIARNRKILNRVFIVLAAILIAYGLNFNVNAKSFWDKIILGDATNFVQYLVANAILVYLVFELLAYLNENFSGIMARFNSYQDISYDAMLIQHVVIYRFVLSYDFSNLSKFGVAFFLVLIIFTTVFLSRQIQKIYKPLEEKLIKGGIFSEHFARYSK